MLHRSKTTQGYSALALILLLAAFAISISYGFSIGVFSKSKSPLEKTVIADEHPIIVDHTSVALFEQIPTQYIEAARNLRMVYMDRSVGQNINEALDCMAYPSASQAPSFCRRPDAQSIGFNPSTAYDRTNWDYLPWPNNCSNWYEKTRCFVNAMTPIINDYDVLSYQFSYLEVVDGSSIDDPVTGYFGTNVSDVSELEAFEASYPNKTVIYWTSSLARSIGSVDAQNFNEQMRQYAIEHNKPLFDVADILSHNPQGTPCYDNRDGVSYTFGARSENYPDDGQNLPAICKEYTSEVDGGHLGNMSTGAIRVAKAYWVLMAQIAGWDPNGTGTTPTNNRPIVQNTEITTQMNSSVAVPLTYTDTDGPGPYQVEIASQPTHGTLTPSTVANAFGYTPNNNYTGDDSFVWSVSDGLGSSTATVTIHVNPINTPPSPEAITPILHWDFNSDSVQPVIGQCTNCSNRGATWTSQGYQGGAFELNGENAYLDLGSSVILSSLSEFTYSMRIKPAFDETATEWRYLFAQGSNNVFFLSNIKDWRILLRTTATTHRADTQDLVWDPNTWHHVVVTYNGSTFNFYWDGVLKATTNVTGTLAYENLPILIGTSPVKSSFFRGVIDDVKIYDRAIAPSAVLGAETSTVVVQPQNTGVVQTLVNLIKRIL